LVVIRVDADFVPFQLERVSAVFESVQFVMSLQIGPPPQSAVYYMGQSFTLRNLQSTIKRPERDETERD